MPFLGGGGCGVLGSLEALPGRHCPSLRRPLSPRPVVRRTTGNSWPLLYILLPSVSSFPYRDCPSTSLSPSQQPTAAAFRCSLLLLLLLRGAAYVAHSSCIVRILYLLLFAISVSACRLLFQVWRGSELAHAAARPRHPAVPLRRAFVVLLLLMLLLVLLLLLRLLLLLLLLPHSMAAVIVAVKLAAAAAAAVAVVGEAQPPVPSSLLVVWLVLLMLLALAAVRLLTAGSLESWHYLQMFPHPTEIALRSSLQVLHLLYVANVRRQQQRLQLKHWRQQHLGTQGEIPTDVLGPTTAAEATETATPQDQEQQQQQQRIGEIDFSVFHNDGVNSSHQLLQHEFALWLRLRRGTTFNTFLPQQHLQQQQRAAGPHNRQGGQQEQSQHSSGSDDTSSATGTPESSGGEDGDAAATAAAQAAASAADGAATHAPAADAAAASAGVTTGGATAAAATAATAAIDAAPGQAVRSMSVDSLFSAGGEAEAGLRSLPASEAAAATAAAAAAAAAAEEEGMYRDGYGLGSTEDLFRSSLMRIVAATAEGGDAGGSQPSALPGYAGSPAAAMASSATVAASISQANIPFNHFNIPERTTDYPVFYLMAHPFVLDASSKADILRRQAAIDQQHQVCVYCITIPSNASLAAADWDTAWGMALL